MILKIINILVYFAFFASIILVTGSPSIFFDETYVTPAPQAIYIGTTNHLLLLGSIINQFSYSGERTIIDRVSWRFPLLIVFNIIYMNLLLTSHYILAFISAFFIAAGAARIHYVQIRSYVPGSWSDKYFIHLPFSLYHGWTSVLLIVTAFEAFGVNAQTDHAGIWTKVFVFLGLLFLLDKGNTLYTRDRDIAGSCVISSGLYSIAYYQSSNFFIKCLAFAIAARASSIYGQPFDPFDPQDHMGSDEE